MIKVKEHKGEEIEIEKMKNLNSYLNKRLREEIEERGYLMIKSLNNKKRRFNNKIAFNGKTVWMRKAKFSSRLMLHLPLIQNRCHSNTIFSFRKITLKAYTKKMEGMSQFKI